MFPCSKDTEIELTEELEIDIIDNFHSFVDLTSNKYYKITDDKGNISTCNQNIYDFMQKNEICHYSFTKEELVIKDDYKIEIDEDLIKSPLNLKVKPVITPECGYFKIPKVTGIRLTLPIGTRFYITYIKLGNNLSKNVGTKIKITRCSEKQLKNKTLFVSNSILDKFTFSE